MTTTTRCELSDLEPSMCSHCRGLDAPVPLDDVTVGHMTTAQHASKCAIGDEWIRPGDDIWRVPEVNGWACERCVREILR